MKQHRSILGIVAAVMMIMACSQHTAVRQDISYSHPTSAEYNYFFLEAIRLQNKGDYAGAFDLLSYCASIDSLAPEAYYLLGVYYSDLNLDSLADASLKRAIELNPKNDFYHERLAQWYIQTHEYSKAIDAYEYLYANNHSRTDVLELLLRLYQQEKNYDKALTAVERIEQVEGVSEATTLEKMQLYQLSGDKQRGYNALKELYDEHPNDVNVKVMMGNWLQQNGRSDEAKEILLEAEQTDPNNEIVATSLYDYYRQNGDDSLATIYRDRILLNKHTATSMKITMLQNIIRNSEQQGADSTEVLTLLNDILAIDSTDADIAELKAVYMQMKEMPEDSVNKALEYVLAIAPDRTSSRLLLLQTKWNKMDLDGIIDLCQPALIYNPDEVAFCYYLGMAYFQRGDTIEALDAFRRGANNVSGRNDSEQMADFYVLIGDIEHQLGHTAEAYAAYDSCLQWMPNNVACLNNYAYFLSLEGTDLKRAENMSIKAVAIEPNNATYLDTYAWVLYMQERYSEAKIIIDRTIENLDSLENNSTIYEHAGDIYDACDDRDKASYFWHQALLLEPDDEATLRRKIKKYEP